MRRLAFVCVPSPATCAATVTVLLGIAVSLSAAAAETVGGRNAMQWLALMDQALTELNYDGVFSYVHGNEVSSLRVVHGTLDGELRERLIHLDGAPREIIRHGDQVACILAPGDKLLELEDSIPSGPFARAFTRYSGELPKSYRLRLGRMGRFASRDAVELVIDPIDGDRFGYRLWADTQTGLLLRSEMMDADGERLETFQFVTVEIGEPIAREDLDPAPGPGLVLHHLTLDEEIASPRRGGALWTVAWLPEGFSMAAWDIRRIPSSLKSVNTLMYNDGLAAFSVFIEDMPATGGGEQVSRRGGTVAVAQPLEVPEDHTRLVTVVGEIPTGTAKRIAASVKRTVPR
jgi:sigma-E factor negative regulatory protein RseB